ncbi:MAG TPA: RNA polymerase sigma factor [Xanthomonadales bacterium]|nr:RNA polymerase sigma factor [Xanthomonadales bacterium]
MVTFAVGQRHTGGDHAETSSCRRVRQDDGRFLGVQGVQSQADDPDADLVAAIARGERAAMATLMNRHLGRLHGLCQRLLGTGAEADDAVQETFLQAWRRAHRWRPGEARFATWLHTVAINRCRDRLRRRTREDIRDDIEPDEVAGDPAIGPEASLAREQSQRQVRAALAELPERQREALILCLHQGMAQSEAAAVLGISEHALESLLARARRHLRRRLLDEPHPEMQP